MADAAPLAELTPGAAARADTLLRSARAPRINGRSACVHATVAAAKKGGESDERLHAVVAWRESRSSSRTSARR
ncbi:carboxymuconolactone decarboxylase family protein [Kitasatospora griseola]|uniref:carboxymuconolactone decarboxylase family protein n=1 Tax=Kitasatospora griseola TaxID=2064 RepID=UPI0036463038